MTVQLVVSPSGQVTGVVPIRRISPAVDREVLNAVRQWVFQPLAGNVPQQSQRGTIEFIFTAN
jgi:protein TonB